ncbi:MAG: GH1 family beta-glucosidase [Clostridiales bacterium]|nr:GH1 family beta-glucosidase [Clostridiales bacterium]MDY5513409.1 GH1 family beta-glucosidase [Candidatus Ventricola sp.]
MGFREDFIWGAATASYQVEGAAREDGRGESIWDRFSHTPGKVFHGDTGDVACDHYHRFAEDAALMRELGIRNYRFSVAWPRLMPEGTGAVNQKGIDFYNRLIDTLLEQGITPFMTLFHWDYPSALQARGAWENPDSPKWFEDYVALCARSFGDRVHNFLTFNEPQCFIGLGYVKGIHAPGLLLPDSSTIPMSHHVLKAHGLAVKALRELAPGARVGYAPCGEPCIPASDSEADIEAARRSYFGVTDDWSWSISWWSDPALLGAYPEQGLQKFGRYLPRGWERDLEIIHQPLDYYAQNIYNGHVVRAADNADGWENVPFPAGAPKTAIQWFISPDALYWGPKFLYERYKTPFLITENGMSCHDAVSLDGKVHDPNREDYMHRYLLAYRRAAEEGVDARGYFAWSLMDNYEWASGYNERFGLVHVDYQTQKRTVKDSAYWYKRVMESNGVIL